MVGNYKKRKEYMSFNIDMLATRSESRVHKISTIKEYRKENTVYVRKIVAKKAIGPTIEASLAMEKNAAMQKQKPMVDVKNNKIQANKSMGLEYFKT